jgi:hypothetical protein
MHKNIGFGTGSHAVEVWAHEEDGTASIHVERDENDFVLTEKIPIADMAANLRRMADFLTDAPRTPLGEATELAKKVAILWRTNACGIHRQTGGGYRDFTQLNDAMNDFAEACVKAGLIPDVEYEP